MKLKNCQTAASPSCGPPQVSRAVNAASRSVRSEGRLVKNSQAMRQS